MLRMPIFIGSRCSLALTFCLLALAAGCGRRATVRTPAPQIQPAIGATENGNASWYGEPYHGRRAASGEIYDMEQFTAAHRTLPFQTWVEVTNLKNDKTVEVRITDRGPFVDGRILDLSLAAARELDMVRDGVVPVRLRVIEPPPNASSPGPTYAVQAGAFADRDRAASVRDKLNEHDARLVALDADPPLWRVLVGRGLNMDAAKRLAQRVEEITGQAFVVPEPGTPRN